MNSKTSILSQKYPFKSTPFFLNKALRSKPGLLKQIFPTTEELSSKGMRDPLNEESYSPIPGLVHRYPNRVLLLTTNDCFGYCRFCTRKRNWGKDSPFWGNFPHIITYLKNHPNINEVIISGGDPLTIPIEKISRFIDSFHKIRHIRILRISTRVLTFSPQTITLKYCKTLSQFTPLYFMTHFNHPDEINELTEKSIKMLRKHGILLMNQSVLLKGINDSQKTLEELSQKLINNGVVPYALHQLDYTESTQHFKVSPAVGRKLIKGMRKKFSGIGIPHYVLDGKNGTGKSFLII